MANMTNISRKYRFRFFSGISLTLGMVGCAPTLQTVKENTELVQNLPSTFPAFSNPDVPRKKDATHEATSTSLNGGVAPTPKENTAPATDTPSSEEPVAVEKTPPTEAEKAEAQMAEAQKAAAMKAEAQMIEAQKAAPDAGWKLFYLDEQLSNLIDLALNNSQDLKIATQEIAIADNEVKARTGEYLPKVGAFAKGGVEKVGKYTSQGVSDSQLEYEPGKTVPEELRKYALGLSMSWEIDIWKKLRNATQAAALRYMSTIDGRNFTITQLVAEIANTYFELLSYDKQLEIVNSNIELQTQALELIQLQKEAARVTSLPVLRFQGEVYKNRSRQFELKQQIVETENKINYLVGRLPQPIPRPTVNFIDMNPKSVASGLPSELLKRRPDVRRAELRLEASKLDLKSARARFYPSLSLEAGAGFESFKSDHLFVTPESTFYNAVGGLTAPLLNRMAIKAEYFSANSKQIQAVYDYERAILNAYTEVVNHLSLVVNMQTALDLKMKQAEALKNAADTSTILYKAARADYVEVLLTRRDALEAQMELVEIKRRQLTSYVNLYKSLGGGWQNEPQNTQVK